MNGLKVVVTSLTIPIFFDRLLYFYNVTNSRAVQTNAIAFVPRDVTAREL